MAYDKSKFRSVRHGVEDESVHCRMCSFNDGGIGCFTKGRAHAKKTGHTVDCYRENWTEYTSYVKDKSL